MKYDNELQQPVVWSSQNVTQWLISNGWSSLVNVFIDYNIQYDRFLNLNTENVEDLLKNMNVSSVEKQRLISSIQKLKAEDQQRQQRPRIAIPSFYNYTRHRNSESSVSTSISTNSSSSLLLPHYNTPNTPSQFDISQYIPKRTSSNETNVSKILEAFHPINHINLHSTSKPKSPRINATDPEILTKLFGKRLPIPQPQDRRIQVTLDADTFIRLWIRYSSNAFEIKKAVLFKLNIDAEPNYFLFYHENGHQSTIPLNDDELVYICQTSDDNHTNRVLVVPLEGYHLVNQQHYQPHTNSYVVSYGLTHTSPTPSPISACSITGIQLTDPETPKEENDALIDLTPPIKSSLSTTDLWATPPPVSETQTSTSASSLWHVRPSVTPSSSSLWPVGEQRSELSNDFERVIEGVSLYDPPTPIHDQPISELLESVVIESPPSPKGSDKKPTSQKSGDSIMSQTPDEDMFGERPTVERLYRDIDKYLPGHDLDKEILLDNNLPASTSPTPAAIPPMVSRRMLGHRQSVRVVAKEAHKRWKAATNNIRLVNNLMRRKSTKMWDRPVERVRPGEESRIILPTSVEPTKMQWMKGNLIARGSFGRVYHALNIATGDWLAVKEVDAVVTESDRRNEALQAASDARYREILLLKDLDHENIVQYIGYDSNVKEGHIYIFLEYVPGGSISSLLSQYKFFDEGLTKYFTRQILQGLQYLHERHILHRDIKGGNVLIDQNGICKITDFGLSKNQQDSGVYDPNSNHSQLKGTLYWMAPEVLTNNYCAKVDVWSLGCTVLEMITGEHPWMKLTTLAAVYQLGQHNSPAIPDHISDEAKDFLKLCFKSQPEDRPTASELLQHPFVQPDVTFDFKESLKLQQPKH